jgi:protein gp37
MVPPNCWLGISLDGKYTNDEMNLMIDNLLNIGTRVRFISFEPLLGGIPDVNLEGIDWVIIGAQTGPGAKPPEKEWVEDIIKEARSQDIPVFLKDNLNWKEQVREWPKGR